MDPSIGQNHYKAQYWAGKKKKVITTLKWKWITILIGFDLLHFSYFWGYFVSQIPGARIAENFSAKYVMLFSVAINVICTILTPVAARFHYIAMIAMRIGEGNFIVRMCHFENIKLNSIRDLI